MGKAETINVPIYLDYLSTTPVDPRVVEAMTQCLSMDGVFGNPESRSHQYEGKEEEAIENALCQVAELINAAPREIVWKSGATEADNPAIKGAAHFYQPCIAYERPRPGPAIGHNGQNPLQKWACPYS